MKTILIQTEKLIAYAGNPRINDHAVEALASAIKRFGFRVPVLAKSDGTLIDGHLRIKAAKMIGLDEVPAVLCDDLSESEIKALRISINRMAEIAEWDKELLAVELEGLLSDGYEVGDIGFTDKELANLGVEGWKNEGDEGSEKSLADKFGVPPFSVLNTRDGWWQNRKAAWLALGIESEEGRNAPAGGSPDMLARQRGESGTSVFDPVLCELIYSWFSDKGGIVLDPFAGGSVRGIVASRLGRKYTGVELRAEQIAANQRQLELCEDDKPAWKQGDSRNIDKLCAAVKADLIFSCPPYADLEVYSDDPADISTLKYEDFKKAYFSIIEKTCSLLKDDRFACFVVGEVRDKSGNYHNFVGDTIAAFKSAGLHFYNEAILVTPCGSVAMRAGKTFSVSRKLGKCHQNVLVFVKGSGKKAADACAEVIVELEQSDDGSES